jgi:hypothetical protein
MNSLKPVIFILLICTLIFAGNFSCGDDDDDDSGGIADTDDDTVADDDDNDDEADDDDVVDDDDSDDDDDAVPDDYIAPWPQNNIVPLPYDETPTAGSLRVKAVEYDQWHLDNHQPYHGGTVGAAFTDNTRTVVDHYFDWNDSCEWTGLYLGSQAMRYHITGDAQAKTNAIRVVSYLSGNLHITQTLGFIARYWAEQDSLIYGGDAWCDDPAQARCHRIETGDFAGNWWWGETSRDMYNGWFFGMSVAFDLVDDEPMRQIIRDDITHVLTTLMDQNWKILNEIGQPTDSAPKVIAPFRLAWLTIGYHVTGNETFKTELQKLIKNDKRTLLRLSSISFMNRYVQYFGACLSHEYWYNLLRLGRAYFSEDDVAFLVSLFEAQTHSYTRLSHNPFFNGVYMGQGGYVPTQDDPYQAQLVEDLTTFRSAPNDQYSLPDRDESTYDLDPLSVLMHDLMVQFPFLADIMGNVKVQALEAFPVDQQCTTDFLFQRNPFRFNACGSDNPKIVNPGVDYLIPYWLASYHKFVTKDM